MTARGGEGGLGTIYRALARSFSHFKIVFGRLEILASRDFLFVELLIAIVTLLRELDLGRR